mmetsp:Transcript_5881/g.15086  ORF Transcript_5881/g.15086 Transcript_5881/m.15086 type:complete len:386 (-) Transcript_5881:158-1315(-)
MDLVILEDTLERLGVVAQHRLDIGAGLGPLADGADGEQGVHVQVVVLLVELLHKVGHHHGRLLLAQVVDAHAQHRAGRQLPLHGFLACQQPRQGLQGLAIDGCPLPVRMPAEGAKALECGNVVRSEAQGSDDKIHDVALEGEHDRVVEHQQVGEALEQHWGQLGGDDAPLPRGRHQQCLHHHHHHLALGHVQHHVVAPVDALCQDVQGFAGREPHVCAVRVFEHLPQRLCASTGAHRLAPLEDAREAPQHLGRPPLDHGVLVRKQHLEQLHVPVRILPRHRVPHHRVVVHRLVDLLDVCLFELQDSVLGQAPDRVVRLLNQPTQNPHRFGHPLPAVRDRGLQVVVMGGLRVGVPFSQLVAEHMGHLLAHIAGEVGRHLRVRPIRG